MTLFENFVTEDNEKADELAKDGAMLDGGEMAQIRASTVQRRKKRRFTRHCRTQLAFTVWWRNGTTVKLKPKPEDTWTSVDRTVEAKQHRTEWCAATGTHRGMRCGRIKKMNM